MMAIEGRIPSDKEIQDQPWKVGGLSSTVTIPRIKPSQTIADRWGSGYSKERHPVVDANHQSDLISQIPAGY